MTPNEGETRTRSATVAPSAENQEWVGVCDWAVDQAQSTVPATAWWVHPATSNPPPERAPSKVSVMVEVVTGPFGTPDFSVVFPSSKPFEPSTARTT